MQNAPPRPPVYNLQGSYLDPDNVRDYLFGEGYVSLVQDSLEDLPPGQVLLARPIPLPNDPSLARAQERNTNWLRTECQRLILVRDSRALWEQQEQFAGYTCLLMGQRGFGAFMQGPTALEWHLRLNHRSVIETAERLHESRGDVRLRINLATEEFDLCGPNTRVCQRSDEAIVSLRPVVHALLMHGLWIDRPDEQFRDLARAMVRLAHDERRRVGHVEFVEQYRQGGR